ncbi:MAG: phosphatidate cytidylyltransferase [Spirochaetaceae bacterium]|nr:phosphatidate cytidylyltransferase [Spirochaetaceae bacterium]MBP3450901.1 phosphatidate cytidylyltransferase [Spirochaetaceae bacterium]MBQ3024249.1 phosphatidate cytidylyltransferase [Spirochaetaceae bacterium]MBQ7904763.1 phosphatidate cytidylyltransferase [Spirochaetaceae bacterium]
MCEYVSNHKSGIILRRYANDISKELFRKLIHLCAAFIPLSLKYFYAPVLVLLSVVLIFYIIAEFLRYKGYSVPLISVITQTAARKRDENKFVLGPVTLTLGIILTALFFDYKSASVGIYALALGDGLASLVGKIFGRTILSFTKGKTVEGSLACFSAIFVSCFLVTKNASTSLIIALIGMFIELLPLKDFDNFFIPIVLAFVMQYLLP